MSAANPFGAPIDQDHLARQTMQDTSLQAELLVLFREQIAECRKEFAAGPDAERRRFLLHRLIGTARNLGAVDLAEAAARAKEGTGKKVPWLKLEAELDRLQQWLAVSTGYGGLGGDGA